MSFSRLAVKWINSFVSLVVAIVLLILGSYSAYSLWDNQQVYEEARDVQLKMKELKPEVVSEDEPPSFADLRAVNHDVHGWVTLDGTKIDYPVLQGENNLTYINTDVYGNFALAGSIYMDCRNSADFSDVYNLLFGHHMANSRMFGDLDLYKDEAFFRKNVTGTLLTEGAVYDLRVAALLLVPASEEGVFDITRYETAEDVISFVRENAVFLNDFMPEPGGEGQFLVFTTCSSEFTDARTVLVTTMIRHR
ncbi:MAG: class B sortase [Clostridia bacterium]|nr:class B sortase [Clostridia bacterium]